MPALVANVVHWWYFVVVLYSNNNISYLNAHTKAQEAQRNTLVHTPPVLSTFNMTNLTVYMYYPPHVCVLLLTAMWKPTCTTHSHLLFFLVLFLTRKRDWSKATFSFSERYFSLFIILFSLQIVDDFIFLFDCQKTWWNRNMHWLVIYDYEWNIRTPFLMEKSGREVFFFFFLMICV